MLAQNVKKPDLVKRSFVRCWRNQEKEFIVGVVFRLPFMASGIVSRAWFSPAGHTHFFLGVASETRPGYAW